MSETFISIGEVIDAFVDAQQDYFMSQIERSFAIVAKGYAGRVLATYDHEERLTALDLSEIVGWTDVQRSWLLRNMPVTLGGFASFLTLVNAKQEVIFSYSELPTAAPDFETFWVAYPATSAEKGAKTVAADIWAKLNKDDKYNAWVFLGQYKKNLKQTQQYPMHVKTYLRQQLWRT